MSGETDAKSEAEMSTDSLPLLADEIIHLDFLSNDPLKSKVINRGTGDVLFEITTPKTWTLHRTTTVHDAQGQEVGKYEQQTFKAEMITFRGEQKKVAEWLPRKNWRSNSRMLAAPDGKTYRWRPHKLKGTFYMVDVASNRTVIETHTASLGILSAKRKMGLDVRPELLPILDAVILSFVFIEEEQREIAAASAGG